MSTATLEAPVIPEVNGYITSVEQFNLLPVGALVQIDNSEAQWERVADRSDGTHMWRDVTRADSLPIRGGNFAAAVSVNQVRLVRLPLGEAEEVAAEAKPDESNEPVIISDRLPQIGEVFTFPTSPDYLFVVVRPGANLDQRVHVVQFNMSSGAPVFHRMTHGSAAWFMARPRFPVAPAWAAVVVPMAEVILGRLGVSAISPMVPENLAADLAEYASMVQDDRFDNLLERHGLSAEVEHRINVTITGYTEWTPLGSEVRESRAVAPEAEILDVEDAVTVRWRRVVEVTRMGRGCVCEDVSREDLAEFVLNDGSSSWDYETECVS